MICFKWAKSLFPPKESLIFISSPLRFLILVFIVDTLSLIALSLVLSVDNSSLTLSTTFAAFSISEGKEPTFVSISSFLSLWKEVVSSLSHVGHWSVLYRASFFWSSTNSYLSLEYSDCFSCKSSEEDPIILDILELASDSLIRLESYFLRLSLRLSISSLFFLSDSAKSSLSFMLTETIFSLSWLSSLS